MASPDRILLSGPDVSDVERQALLDAFDSGWIAPVGPDLDRFERDLADYVGVEAVVALSSGTAGLHLGLLELGVGPGDRVLVPSATFAASAFAVTYCGAEPVFCDVDPDSWTIDVDLVESILTESADSGRPLAAVMPVDLYGVCADYVRLGEVCKRFGVGVLSDAAESLGSRCAGGMAGSFGDLGVVSFNGNKVMTTSGGGALLGERDQIDHCRYLATQARSDASHYEHEVIGFNYRLSNLLGAIGRAQLSTLEAKIERRAKIRDVYKGHSGLGDLEWPDQRTTLRPNNWLNVALLPDGVDPLDVSKRLAESNIEARRAWKPMHLQPVFAGAEMTGGAVSEEVFRRGICLPSGSGLSADQVDRVCEALVGALS